MLLQSLLKNIAAKNATKTYRFSSPNYLIVFDGNQVVKQVIVLGVVDNELKDLLNNSLSQVQSSILSSISGVTKANGID